MLATVTAGLAGCEARQARARNAGPATMPSTISRQRSPADVNGPSWYAGDTQGSPSPASAELPPRPHVNQLAEENALAA